MRDVTTEILRILQVRGHTFLVVPVVVVSISATSREVPEGVETLEDSQHSGELALHLTCISTRAQSVCCNLEAPVSRELELRKERTYRLPNLICCERELFESFVLVRP